jgi:hypothetical protein
MSLSPNSTYHFHFFSHIKIGNDVICIIFLSVALRFLGSHWSWTVFLIPLSNVNGFHYFFRSLGPSVYSTAFLLLFAFACGQFLSALPLLDLNLQS